MNATTKTKGRIKVAGRFVGDDDLVMNSTTYGITAWRRGEVCVARLEDGREGRAQFSDHGPGRKSVQVFDADGKLIADINTSY